MNTKETTVDSILKKLEEEYLDIFSGQVEFKKGYRDYSFYKEDIKSQLKQLLLEKSDTLAKQKEENG